MKHERYGVKGSYHWIVTVIAEGTVMEVVARATVDDPG